jgi:uncharacterized protein
MEQYQNNSFNSPIWLKKIGLVVLFFTCYLILGGILIYGGYHLLAIQLGISDKILEQLSNSDSQIKLYSYSINFTATILIIYLFWKFIIKKDFQEIGFIDKNWLRNLVLGMVSGIAAISIGFIICLIFGLVKIESISFSPPDFSNYLIIFALVSISEEVMTRGLMLNTLMEGMNDYLALLIVAIIFGALHLLNDNVTTLSFINICIAGIFLGISYIHNRSLWFPIGLHFTWNFFQGPVYGYEVSGHKNVSIIGQTIHGNDTFTGGEFGFEGSIIAIPIMLLAIFVIHIYYLKESKKTEVK